MGWKHTTYNSNHVNPIKCKDCKKPREYVKRADNPNAYDYPLRFAEHNCPKKRKLAA